MTRHALDLDALAVDSFRTGTEPDPFAVAADPQDPAFAIGHECTGCMSGCGVLD